MSANLSEWKEGHIPGAIHIEAGRMAWDELPFPHDKPLAIQCASGSRSMSVSSVLRRRGYHNMIQVEGGINKWKMHGFEITKENSNTQYRMSTTPAFPSFDVYLADLNQFVLELVENYKAGKIKSWDDLEAKVNAYFTPARMEHIETSLCQAGARWPLT